MFENELNSNFIKDFRDIVDDFQYCFNSFKIRESILKKRQNSSRKINNLFNIFSFNNSLMLTFVMFLK